jgi:hypothetical protein
MPSNVDLKGFSWFATCSRDGLVCSKIFNRLQYSTPGENYYPKYGDNRVFSTVEFNDILPIRFEDRSSEKHVLVTLASSSKSYWVAPSELEDMTRWRLGTYTLQKEGLDGDECSMIIQQEDLTNHISIAAAHLEDLRLEFNVQVALARRDRTSLSKHSFPEF